MDGFFKIGICVNVPPLKSAIVPLVAMLPLSELKEAGNMHMAGFSGIVDQVGHFHC